MALLLMPRFFRRTEIIDLLFGISATDDLRWRPTFGRKSGFEMEKFMVYGGGDQRVRGDD